MSQHRGGERARVNRDKSSGEPFNLTHWIREQAGMDPKTGRPVKRGTYGALPPSARVVTQYPEGIPTGVGGGNAAQAQSVDPTAPAYIKPYSSSGDGGGDGGGGGGGGTGRSAPAPNGSGAKGTQTSFKGFEIDLGIAEKALGRRIADVNNFISTQLPAGPNQKSSSTNLSNDDFILQAQRGGYLDTFRGKTNDEAVLHAQNAGFTPDVVVEGSSTPGKTSTTPADVADNKRVITIDRDFGGGARGDDDERTDFTRDYGDYEGTDYSPIRQARRAAFLSGDDGPGSSIRAVRAANNAVGTAKFGNKHYVNDGGTLREVTADAYGKANTSGLSAEELKDAYIKPIKEAQSGTATPVATKDGFEGSSQLEGIYDQGISKARPAVNGIDYNQQTEFSLNNVYPGEAEDQDFVSPESYTKFREAMKTNYFARQDDDDDE